MSIQREVDPRITEFEAKLVECEKDAERYRLVRQINHHMKITAIYSWIMERRPYPINEREYDAIIDAAIARSKDHE